MNLFSNFMLFKLDEGDKKFIIILILIILAILALLIVLCLGIEAIAKKQGREVGNLMYDITKGNMVKDSKTFIKLSNKKSRILFYRRSRIWILLLLIHFIASIIYISIMKTSYSSLWIDADKYGIATIFYLFKFVKPEPGTTVVGFVLEVTPPHFSLEAVFSYIAIPVFFVGLIGFSFQVLGFIARSFHTIKLSKKIFGHEDEIEELKVDTTKANLEDELQNNLENNNTNDIEKNGND